MKTLVRAAVLAAGCASLGACATVTRGTTTAWEVSTSPAGATVHTTDGRECTSTPCALRVGRRAEFIATISKPGYQPVDVRVSHGLSTMGGIAFAGNALIGGLLGAGVDIATGAVNDLAPNNLNLKLEPTAPRYLTDYALISPPLLTAQQGVAEAPAPAAPARNDGRVIDYKLLSNGAVEQTREGAY